MKIFRNPLFVIIFSLTSLLFFILSMFVEMSLKLILNLIGWTFLSMHLFIMYKNIKYAKLTTGEKFKLKFSQTELMEFHEIVFKETGLESYYTQ